MSLPPSKRSLFLVDFLTGISDGLVLPLAACIIAAWLSAPPTTIALATGMGVALAGAVVFGWARYAGEREEIRHKHPELGLDEAEKELALLQKIGIDAGLTEAMKTEMEQERALWLKEIREHDLGWEEEDGKRARRSGLYTAAGFFAGGILVTIPFIVCNGEPRTFIFPCCWALFCLSVLGWTKGYITGKNPAGGALRQGLRGLAIMVIACLVTWTISRLQ